MLSLVLLASPAVAAEWWVADAHAAEQLTGVLSELWPAAHEVRVGAGEGFVLQKRTLSWVGDVDVRTREVSDLREAVVLARSWEQGLTEHQVGWVPDELRSQGSRVRFVDVEHGAPAKRWFAGAQAGVGQGLNFGLRLRRLSRLRLDGGLVLTPRAWDEPQITLGEQLAAPPPRILFDLQVAADYDLLPGAVRIAPGLGLASHHEAGGRAGYWLALQPSVELGGDVGVWTLGVRGMQPIGLLRSLESKPLPDASVLVRTRTKVPMELTAGLRPQALGPAKGWVNLAVFMDLGGQR